ncbi:MAG: hypothetical protein A2X86_01465 [Bdellovibrionales bacterium GWA2_49_15]|nr:MAG: hypothetical protein A2X86_01465 [Bdellovibrionales bacterium GWA2_49_15]
MPYISKYWSFFLCFAALSSQAWASTTLVFVGDLMQHITQHNRAVAHGGKRPDYRPFFAQIVDELTGQDLLSANLEFPVIRSRPPSGYPQFNGTIDYLHSLKDMGFDLLTTANNHAADQTSSGVLATLDELDSLNFLHVGSARTIEERDEGFPIWRAPDGTNIAFLSYTFSTNGIPFRPSHLVNLINLNESNGNLSLIERHIKKARERGADVVIVQCHWGAEYENFPLQSVKNNARQILNMGADAIVGHHPHVVQPYEFVTTKDGRPGFIHYSLGNFFSGQTSFPKNVGLILKLTVNTDQAGVTFTPQYIATVVRPSDYVILNADELTADCETRQDQSSTCNMAKNASSHVRKIVFAYQRK